MPPRRGSGESALQADRRALMRLFSEGETVVLAVWGSRDARSHVHSVLAEVYDEDTAEDTMQQLREEADVYLAKRLKFILKVYLESGRVDDDLLNEIARVLRAVDSDGASFRVLCACQRAGNLAGLLSLFRDLKAGYSAKASLRLARDFLAEGGPSDVSEVSRGELNELLASKPSVYEGESELEYLRWKGCSFLGHTLASFKKNDPEKAARMVAKYLRQEPVHELVAELRDIARKSQAPFGAVGGSGGSMKKRRNKCRPLIKGRVDDEASSSDEDSNHAHRAGRDVEDDDDGDSSDNDGKEMANRGYTKKNHVANVVDVDVDENEFLSTGSEPSNSRRVRTNRHGGSGRKRKGKPEARTDLSSSDQSESEEVDELAAGAAHLAPPENRSSARKRTKSPRREPEPVSPFSASDDRKRPKLKKRRHLSDQISPLGSPSTEKLPKLGKAPLKRGAFSPGEDNAIREGLKTHGWGAWSVIVESGNILRTNVQVKDRARTMGLGPEKFPERKGTHSGRPRVHVSTPERPFGKKRPPAIHEDGEDIDSCDDSRGGTDDDPDEAENDEDEAEDVNHRPDDYEGGGEVASDAKANEKTVNASSTRAATRGAAIQANVPRRVTRSNPQTEKGEAS